MVEFELFKEIKHKPLRVYNRVVMLNNLLADAGADMARAYVSQFNELERKEMLVVQSAINSKGPKAVKEEVTKGLEFKDFSDVA